MRLAWRGSTVFLKVAPLKQEQGGGPPTASRMLAEPEPCSNAPVLAVDLCALGKVPLLRVRNTTVCIDGRRWQPVRGIAGGSEFNRAELAEALSPGLLCIMTIREASGQQEPQGHRAAHALHLEASSRTRILSRQ
eukprot:UN3923